MRTADGRWVWVRDKARPVYDDDGRIGYWQGFMVDVSVQMEAEGRLRQAEARYRAMVELIPAVTYTDFVGPDGVTSMGFVSPQMEAILGFPPQRFLDDAGFWFELMHPDDLAHLRSIDAFNNADFEVFDHEYRMHHADGHWVWVHDISTAVLDAQGNLDYFLGFLTDVSSRRDAEERLREAELTFRTLVEQSPAVFYVQGIDPADPSRSLTEYIGPGAEELTGVPIEQMTANPEVWRTMIHPDDQARVFAADAATNTDGSNAFSLEYRMIRTDGRVVWVLDEATLIRPEGRFPYWQGFQLDITARKEAEQRLQDAHEHLRLMVESSLDAVVSMDMEGMIIGWNPQAETTFGWSADEVLGHSLVETIVPHAHRAAHNEGLRRFHDTGEGAVLNSRIEIQALRRDGRMIPVELAIVPVSVGEETVFSGFIRDISERKRAQEDLERALEVEREAAAAPASARRDEGHVPPGRLPRPADAAGRDPRDGDHARARRRGAGAGGDPRARRPHRAQRPPARTIGHEPPRSRPARARRVDAELRADRRRRARSADGGRRRHPIAVSTSRSRPSPSSSRSIRRRSSGSSRTSS